jgi:hypothetical protein
LMGLRLALRSPSGFHRNISPAAIARFSQCWRCGEAHLR